jgi:alkanesulfonate monooxygenase SsuD/methylene tetrahydromethanopterin reductase-like flavin-dependent oxidoreductase (luciferase family)
VKLCLSIEVQEGLSFERTLTLARSAEDAGFHAALLAEHYTSSSGNDDSDAPDAWMHLAALARETERIRLGTLVSPVTFRHPAVLAKMAATLDHMSGGRAELGLGAGWLETEHTAYGFPFRDGTRRVDLLEEQLQVIKGLWTEDPFSHSGAEYRLAGCRFTPKPRQHPHPPLIVGGRPDSRRLLRLAETYANEYVISVPTPEECRAVREKLDAACALSAFTYACIAPTAAKVERRVASVSERLRPQMRDTTRWIIGRPAEAERQLGRLGRGAPRRPAAPAGRSGKSGCRLLEA